MVSTLPESPTTNPLLAEDRDLGVHSQHMQWAEVVHPLPAVHTLPVLSPFPHRITAWHCWVLGGIASRCCWTPQGRPWPAQPELKQRQLPLGSSPPVNYGCLQRQLGGKVSTKIPAETQDRGPAALLTPTAPAAAAAGLTCGSPSSLPRAALRQPPRLSAAHAPARAGAPQSLQGSAARRQAPGCECLAASAPVHQPSLQ